MTRVCMRTRRASSMRESAVAAPLVPPRRPAAFRSASHARRGSPVSRRGPAQETSRVGERWKQACDASWDDLTARHGPSSWSTVPGLALGPAVWTVSQRRPARTAGERAPLLISSRCWVLGVRSPGARARRRPPRRPEEGPSPRPAPSPLHSGLRHRPASERQPKSPPRRLVTANMDQGSMQQ